MDAYERKIESAEKPKTSNAIRRSGDGRVCWLDRVADAQKRWDGHLCNPTRNGVNRLVFENPRRTLIADIAWQAVCRHAKTVDKHVFGPIPLGFGEISDRLGTTFIQVTPRRFYAPGGSGRAGPPKYAMRHKLLLEW